MALAVDQQNLNAHSFSWYWDDDNDYDLFETTESLIPPRLQQIRKAHLQNWPNHSLDDPSTTKSDEGHIFDGVLIVAHGVLGEHERRWTAQRSISYGRSPGFCDLSADKRERFRVNDFGSIKTRLEVRARRRQSPELLERHQDPEINFSSNVSSSPPSLFADCADLLSSPPVSWQSVSRPTQWSSPSSSSVPWHNTQFTDAASALDNHGTLPSLSPALHPSTCKGKAEMALDEPETIRKKRGRPIEQEQEVDQCATLRFLQSHFSLDCSTTSEDMECIWEEDEEYEGDKVDLNYRSSTTAELVDAESRGRSGYSHSSSDNANGRSTHQNGSSGHSGHISGDNRGRTGYAGRGGDDDDEDRRPKRGGAGNGQPPDYYFSYTYTSSEEEYDSDADYYSASGGKSSEMGDSANISNSSHLSQSNAHSQKATRVHQKGQNSSTPSDSDSDDVPLAQSHPTALRAQQSIRVKDRQRRKERKLEKEREKLGKANQEATRRGVSSVRGASAQAPDALGLSGMSSTQEAMLHASVPFSSSPPSMGTHVSSFSPINTHSSPKVPSPSLPKQTELLPAPVAASPTIGDATILPSSVPAGTVILRSQRGRTRAPTISGNNPPNVTNVSQVPPSPVPQQTSPHNQHFSSQAPPPQATKGLKPMRSSHNIRGNTTTAAYVAPPAPSLPATNLARSHTRGRSQSNAYAAVPMVTTASAPPVPSHHPAPVAATTSRARSRSRPPPTRNPYPTDEFGALTVNPSEPLARRSTESRRSGGRPSAENPRGGVEVPPVELMPALPSKLANQALLEIRQLKIHITNRQSFLMVELTSATNAGDVLQIARAMNKLPPIHVGSDAGTGRGVGWVVWEINVDTAVERPVRPYEQLLEVQKSWKDRTENTFIIKYTPEWEQLLRQEAIPAAAPTYSGYLEYEVKRGKWNKRWLVLKDHGLYISKRDNCKDQTLLASLSNFDIYSFINTPTKLPKEYGFVVKSTDRMSLFEDTNDYMHVFSCRDKDGEKWMQRIRIAKSYVLFQERNVLFAPATSQAAVSSPTVGSLGLGRSGTTKRRVPTQPLVQMGDGNIFAKGSLLSGQV